MAEVWRETFKIVGTNTAQLNAGSVLVIEDRENAEKHGNLPHNAFVIANQDVTSTLYIFLDDFSDQDKPDYILFPSQQITVGIEDGVHFTTLWIKNTHATNNISANSIKYRISTIKKVNI